MKRFKHSLSHYKLMSMSMGYLVPCGLVEVLPGDTLQHSTSMLVRVSPLVAPVMHPVHLRIHHWFVPHRLVWDNWEPFITGGPDGMNASVFPTITFGAGGYNAQSLPSYMGLPTAETAPYQNVNPVTVSALPFRGYALIFNEWYRDQDLVNPLVISKADGNDTTTNTIMQRVAWEKDYYTTARPWTQKGPTVTIPLEGSAPITGIQAPTGSGPYGPGSGGLDTAGNSISYAHQGTGASFNVLADSAGPGGVKPQIFADLSGVSAADINSLRLAFALQRYEEARARYGSRYTEYLRYLGVRSSDARLQRPEYLGGGKETIQFSEVLQTAGTSVGAPTGVGNLAGHGIGAARSNRYRRFFEEHGYVFSFVSVKPRTIYAQGIEKTWLRRTKEDFWQQELQHIGQQEVHQAELYGDTTTPNTVFGYQDRYDEYRRQESKVAGQFRTTLLDFWHFARIFSTAPTLNDSFVQSNPTVRPFADQTGNDTLNLMVSHSIQARRMVAASGTSFIF